MDRHIWSNVERKLVCKDGVVRSHIRSNKKQRLAHFNRMKIDQAYRESAMKQYNILKVSVSWLNRRKHNKRRNEIGETMLKRFYAGRSLRRFGRHIARMEDSTRARNYRKLRSQARPPGIKRWHQRIGQQRF